MRKLTLFILLQLAFFISPSYSLIESEAFPELVYASALKEGNIEVTEQYLEMGHSSTRMDSSDLIPLAYAIQNNSLAMIDLLIKYKADVKAIFLERTTPLIYSVLLEKTDLIDPLIEKGSEINFQDNLGRTAIMIAVERENIRMVKKLLKHSPDLEITDFSGKSVYDYLDFVRKREIKKLFE